MGNDCPDVMGPHDPLHKRYRTFEDLRGPLDGDGLRLARIEAKLDELLARTARPGMAAQRWNLP